MVPSATASQMKWNRRSICFVLTWNWPSLDRAMVAWLLQFNTVGVDNGLVISRRNALSQRASFVAWAAAMYSASVVESATRGCFLELQLTAPPFIRNAYPEMECWWYCEAWSVSEYLIIPVVVAP